MVCVCVFVRVHMCVCASVWLCECVFVCLCMCEFTCSQLLRKCPKLQPGVHLDECGDILPWSTQQNIRKPRISIILKNVSNYVPMYHLLFDQWHSRQIICQVILNWKSYTNSKLNILIKNMFASETRICRRKHSYFFGHTAHRTLTAMDTHIPSLSLFSPLFLLHTHTLSLSLSHSHTLTWLKIYTFAYAQTKAHIRMHGVLTADFILLLKPLWKSSFAPCCTWANT